MRIRGGSLGWVAAVGASVAGCIPEPMLRPRDAGGSADLPAMSDVASMDVATTDVPPTDAVAAPDVVALDTGAWGGAGEEPGAR